MRTTLDLPDEIFRMLKVEAALRGTTLKDFTARLIETGLMKTAGLSPEPRTRSQLPILREPTGSRHPALRNAEIESLLTADDSHVNP